MHLRPGTLAASLLVFALCACTGNVREPATAPTPRVAAHDVIGVEPVHLDADYWVRKRPDAAALVIDATGIAARNARLHANDPSVNGIERLPPELDGARVRAWIEGLSAPPSSPLFDTEGAEITATAVAGLRAALALDEIPERQPTRFGLVTQRADLRTFPTARRVFNAPGNTDIDRFQESALFPGTPVAIVHASRDGAWWFVVSDLYEAWIDRQAVAIGSPQQVFGYARKSPYVVVTGADVRTTYTPELPQVSELRLEMGVRVPLLDKWPRDRSVNGQHPYTAHVVELPVRGTEGALAFAPALLPLRADVAIGYLPLTRAALLHQGFKFLGERYGWGHSYNARDCSGFVSEVYRSFGVTLPRNTGDQAVSTAFNRIAFDERMGHAERLAVLRTLDVGDLVYIPGHVMMVIGHEEGLPYVIHDTTGISYRGRDGALRHVLLNGVAVTPLAPLMAGETEWTIDRITSVQRIRR